MNVKTLSKKMEGVSQLMTNGNVSEFVLTQVDLKEAVEQRLKSLNIETLTKDIQEKLFWRRNRILHHSDKPSTEEDAKKSFSWAKLIIEILRRMDFERRRTV